MTGLRLMQGEGQPATTNKDGLPPVPTDPAGRHVSWVVLLSSPHLHYTFAGDKKPTKIEVDAAFIARQVKLYATMQGESFTAPVIDGHDEQANPERRGDVLTLEAWTDPADGALKLIGAVAWVDADAPEKIERGALKYLSGGWGTIRDEDGREIAGVLRHLGVVPLPHQLNIDGGRGRHILNAQPPNDGADTMDGDLTLEMLAEQLAALSARLDLMQEESDPEEGDDEESDPADVEMSQPTPEAVALSQRNAELERQNFDLKFPAGAIITLTPEMMDACYTLSNTSPDAFEVLTLAAKEPPVVQATTPPPAPPKATPPGRFVQWGVQMANGGGSESEAAPPSASGDPVDKEVARDALYKMHLSQANGDGAVAWTNFEAAARAQGLLPQGDN